jgi:hypothetical protein
VHDVSPRPRPAATITGPNGAVALLPAATSPVAGVAAALLAAADHRVTPTGRGAGSGCGYVLL